jgi:predicted nucleic acid-binding protein
MPVCFADTSFWIALQVARDTWHADAVGLWRASGDRVLTTNLIVGETWTAIRRKAGHRPAVAFYSAVIADARVTVELVDETMQFEAWEWLLRHDEREYSFVDATSFAFMRGKRIRNALAFDGDFSAAGFTELRPNPAQ